MIGGILLAAGSGTRSAVPNKLLVRDRDGVPMVCRSAMALQASRLDRICVVLGHQAEQVRAAVATHCPGLPDLIADDHANGLAASLVRGVAFAAQEGWDATVIFLADMPRIGHPIIDTLIEAYLAARPGLDAVVPFAAGRRANPVLWDARMFPRLSALRGDRGGRDLLDDVGLSVLDVSVADDSVLTDHDTPEALVRFSTVTPPVPAKTMADWD